MLGYLWNSLSKVYLDWSTINGMLVNHSKLRFVTAVHSNPILSARRVCFVLLLCSMATLSFIHCSSVFSPRIRQLFKCLLLTILEASLPPTIPLITGSQSFALVLLLFISLKPLDNFFFCNFCFYVFVIVVPSVYSLLRKCSLTTFFQL